MRYRCLVVVTVFVVVSVKIRVPLHPDFYADFLKKYPTLQFVCKVGC